MAGPDLVIGEDDVLMRAGLVCLLADEGLSVVAEAGDARELLSKAIAHQAARGPVKAMIA
jgi:DNA-binding NarL/FixJ family response regulator